MKKENFVLFLALIVFLLSIIFNIDSNTKASFADNSQGDSEKTLLKNQNINCILRSNIYGDWKIFTNETHDNFGCGKIDQTEKYIKLSYEEPFQKVTGVAITGDDNVSRKRVTTGSSVGLKALRISLYQDGQLLNPKDLKGAYTNIYVTVWGLK